MMGGRGACGGSGGRGQCGGSGGRGARGGSGASAMRSCGLPGRGTCWGWLWSCERLTGRAPEPDGPLMRHRAFLERPRGRRSLAMLSCHSWIALRARQTSESRLKGAGYRGSGRAFCKVATRPCTSSANPLFGVPAQEELNRSTLGPPPSPLDLPRLPSPQRDLEQAPELHFVGHGTNHHHWHWQRALCGRAGAICPKRGLQVAKPTAREAAVVLFQQKGGVGASKTAGRAW